MDNTDTPIPEYLKGFNTGYMLCKSEPELLNQVLQTENNWSVYIEGIRAGQKEYLKEIGLEKVQAKSNLQKPDYQKAFNLSYTIAKYDIKLSDQLSSISNGTENLGGFRAGREQVLAERKNNRLPSFLKENPFKKSDIDPSIERNTGIEPEK